MCLTQVIWLFNIFFRSLVPFENVGEIEGSNTAHQKFKDPFDDHDIKVDRKDYFFDRFFKVTKEYNLRDFLFCYLLYQKLNTFRKEDFNNENYELMIDQELFKTLYFHKWFLNKKAYLQCGKNLKKRLDKEKWVGFLPGSKPGNKKESIWRDG